MPQPQPSRFPPFSCACSLLTALSVTLAAALLTGCSDSSSNSGNLDGAAVFDTSDLPVGWAPEGPRNASAVELSDPVIPSADRFTTIHGGIRSSDEVNIAYAPLFKAQWTAEPRSFLPEGPSFDRQGNLYITPLFPTSEERDILIAIDGASGQRRWAITEADLGGVTINGTTLPAFIGQGGAPLVLNDPATGNDIIYSGSFARVFAVNTEGELLWNRPVLPQTLLANQALAGSTHLFGLSYHPSTDASMAVFSSGDLVAFDRTTGARLGATIIPGAPSQASTSTLPPGVQNLMRESFEAAFDLPDFGDALDIGEVDFIAP